jgi:hypothetical protein
LQESITNVIRHVGPTWVTVTLGYGMDALKVCVTDEGRRHATGDYLAGCTYSAAIRAATAQEARPSQAEGSRECASAANYWAET